MNINQSIAGYQELQCSNCSKLFDVHPGFDVDAWDGLCDECRQDKKDRMDIWRETNWEGNSDGTVGVDE